MELFDASARRVRPASLLASGGEGSIYELEGDSRRVAKIYHPERVSAELHSKIKAMVEMSPDDPTWASRKHHSIAWPESALYADPSRSGFTGYVMPKVDRDLFREAHLFYDTQDRIRRFGGSFTWKHLFVAAFNLSSAVAAIHEKGHRIGDLRDTNTLVGPNSLVTLIDCDSFEVRTSGRTFFTRVGVGEFLPAELQGTNFATSEVDRLGSDLFALAVLIFKFLMLGTHPYQAKGPRVEHLSAIESKIREGTYPYEGSSGISPPDYAPGVDVLPPSIRRLFARTFIEGHRRPEVRPDAKDWFSVLETEGPHIKTCKRNPNHSFGAHLRSCPWCRLAKSKIDPFPPGSYVGRQITTTSAGSQPNLKERFEVLRPFVSVALADGPMTPEESRHIAKLAGEMGLRKAEVSRLIKEEEQRAPRVKAIPAKQRNGLERAGGRDLSELLKMLREHRTDDARREVIDLTESRVTLGLGAFMFAVTAASLTMPALTLGFIVLMLIPAMATSVEVTTARAEGTRLLKLAAMVAPRFLQGVTQTLYHLVPFGLLGLAVMIGGYYMSVRWIGIQAGVFFSISAPVAAIAWLFWILRFARGEDAFLDRVRISVRGACYWLTSPQPRLRPAFGLAFLAACTVLAAAGGFQMWWPFSSP